MEGIAKNDASQHQKSMPNSWQNGQKSAKNDTNCDYLHIEK